MSSEQDQNVLYSGTKIQPLWSPVKSHAPHDTHGVIGEEHDIEETHEEPLHSSIKHHHLQMPHADSQGVVGFDEIIQSTKIAPMDGKMKQSTQHTIGLADEMVDAARILPMGEVREE